PLRGHRPAHVPRRALPLRVGLPAHRRPGRPSRRHVPLRRWSDGAPPRVPLAAVAAPPDRRVPGPPDGARGHDRRPGDGSVGPRRARVGDRWRPFPSRAGRRCRVRRARRAARTPALGEAEAVRPPRAMKAMPTRYWGASQSATSERRRLELLEARYDPLTLRRFDALGASAGGAGVSRAMDGWSCLEVGAGAGSVARFLAERVGPAGGVVATDLDPRFLGAGDRLPLNVEVRRHDILTDPLEEGAFDLVHCRALLCHLDEPVVALTRMAAALRPGGWLLVEDADYI